MKKVLPRALKVFLFGGAVLLGFDPNLKAQTAAQPSADTSNSQAEQDFFGADQPTVEKAKNTEQDPTLAFTTQGVKWGGVLYDKIEWNGGWVGDWPKPAFLSDNWRDSVGFTLNNLFYLDSRPDKNYRVKVSLVSNWPFTDSVTTINSASYVVSPPGVATTSETATVPTVRIWELFADVTLYDSIFVRFGKQEASWGVAYFYSAGDVLSLTGIDPTNPTAEREGPIALKVSVPLPNQHANLFAYTVAPDAVFSTAATSGGASPTFRDLGYALQGDVTLGGAEWSLGGYYQQSQSKKLVGSVTGGLGWLNLPFSKDVNWFTEQIAAYGADRWLGSGTQTVGSGSTSYQTFANLDKPWQTYLSSVWGVSYSNSEYNGSFRLEYYYNGEGSNDQTYSQNLYNAYYYQAANPTVFPSVTLGASDIVYPGAHNLTALLTFTTLNNTKFDTSALCQQNFSDGSGWIKPLLTYNFNNFFSLYTGLEFVWGKDGTEFPLQFLSYSGATPQTQRLTMVLGGQIGSSRY